MGWLGRLFGSNPHKALLAAARSLADEDRYDEAIERYDAYREHQPDDLQASLELARLLVKAGREDEAAEFVFAIEPVAPLVLLAQGETAAAQGETARALELLAAARDWYRREIQTNFESGASFARAGHRDASMLHDELYASLHGREQVVVARAREATLDARAGVNYRLLGDSLMVGSRHQPESRELESVEAMRRRYDGLDGDEQEGVRGLLLLGTIAYREQLADDAVEAFRRAVAADGTHFAAFRGLGAAMDMQTEDRPRKATRLPKVATDGWNGFAKVVPDLAALTPTERAIVACSIAPLRHALPRLAKRGTRIVVMPFDVRTTDFEEFEDGDAHRFDDDHRSLGAISGVASAKLALVRLDELYAVHGEHCWTFAHEFAHLAHRCLAPRVQDEIRAAHARATRAGFVASAYAQKNDAEFLAVGYADYVHRRYVTNAPPPEDPLGIHRAMDALFERLEGDPTAFV